MFLHALYYDQFDENCILHLHFLNVAGRAGWAAVSYNVCSR